MHFANEHPGLRRKYEQLVASQDRIGFFDQIWVQDILHPTWQYLLNEQQEPILRIPLVKKYGLKAYLQPLFLRSLPVLNELSRKEISYLEANWFLHLNLQFTESKEEFKNHGQYQKLRWDDGIEEIRKGYADNHRRILKKAKNLELRPIEYQCFQDFFIAQKGEHLGNLTASAWQRLAALVSAAKKMDQGMCFGVFDGSDLLAVGLFFRLEQQLYFMKGTLNERGKAVGALVFLIDAVLEQFASECTTLDFVGSNQASIANFYRKFGAKDHFYQVLKGRWPFV
jgi:hypothetical protein